MVNLKYALYRAKWHMSQWITGEWPVHVDLELSSYCNLKCSFCPHSSFNTEFEKSFMSLNLFKKVIDEIEGHVPSIKLNLRGESTLHPQFAEFLNYVKGKFVDIRLNTNGQYDKQLNDIMVDVLTTISFSVDNYDQFELKRLKGENASLDFLNKNLHYLYFVKKFKNITLSFVHKENQKNKIMIWTRQLTHTFPKVKFFIRQEFDRKLAIRKTDGAVGRKNCYMPNRRLVIVANGDVYPCCVQWQKPFLIIGDMNKNTIFNIWNSYYLNQLRNMLVIMGECDTTKQNEIYDHVKKITGGSLPLSCLNCGSRESYRYK